MKFTWDTFKRVKAAKTVGSKLSVDLPALGIESVLAKIDTGAYNGALHANRIREVSDGNGQAKLRFSPLGSPDHTLEIDTYHKRRVKSSNGQATNRYAIDTEISIMGQTYPITLTLTNRSFMKHQMLIGRNFLRLHGFLVDVNTGNK